MSTDHGAHSALAQRRELSGLEFFKRMMAGEDPPPPMVSLLGSASSKPAKAASSSPARPASVLQRHGRRTAAGAATILDTALGCAINTCMPAGRSFATLELKINYTRPLRREVGELRCEATVIHAGNRTATSEGRLVSADGKIYAHGTATCILVERHS